MLYDTLHCRRGVTLIELMIATAILALVIGMAFSLFDFGNRLFREGSGQYDTQSAARLASHFISEEVRYAADIEIVPSVDAGYISDPASIPMYLNYLYYDSSLESIVRVNSAGAVSKKIGSGGSLTFSSASPYKGLDYVLTAKSGLRSFEVNNQVLGLNIAIGNSSTITDSTGAFSGPAIKYSTGSDYVSGTMRPLVELNATNTDMAVVLEFNRVIDQSGVNTKITENNTGKTASITYPDSKTLRVSFVSGVPNNKDFSIDVSFIDYDGATTIYNYKLRYTNHDNWHFEL